MKVRILQEVQTIKKPEVGKVYDVIDIMPTKRLGGVEWIIEIDGEFVGLLANEIEILEVQHGKESRNYKTTIQRH